MTGSLRTRLVGAMLSIAVLVIGATFLLSGPLIASSARRDVGAQLDGVIARVSVALDDGAADAVLDAQSRRHSAQLDLYSAADDRVAASGAASPRMTPRELAAVRGDGRTLTVRDVEDGEWVAVAVALDGGRVLRAARPTPVLDSTRDAFVRVTLIAALFAVILVLLISEYLARTIGRPIRDMREAAEALGQGDLSHRIRSRRADELGALAGAIDRMAEHLAERVEAVEREEERLRTILDGMVEGVFVTDGEGRIVLTNAALVELAGGEVEGRSAVEAIRSAELHEAVKAVTEREALEIEFEITVGGSRRAIAAQLAPLQGRPGVVAVLHDVTQLKRVDKVRRDFVANASHELRTPLTAIRGFAETLQDGVPNDEMRERFLRNIDLNARRLQNLVEDLLALSRAESPDSEILLGPVDVALVAAGVVGGLERRAAEKSQALVLDVPDEELLATADGRSLDQVLLNLVDNAIKYTPEGGEITLSARRGDGQVVIEVSDTGPGIAAKHLDRIFERFYRVDKGRARAEGGTGLGLSIVRHLVSRMRGDVSVSSTVGEGTRFTLRLDAP